MLALALALLGLKLETFNVVILYIFIHYSYIFVIFSSFAEMNKKWKKWAFLDFFWQPLFHVFPSKLTNAPDETEH